MSSSFPTTPTLSPPDASTTPSSSPSSSPSSGLTGSAGNYFYGFLVTFIGLLLIFVSCGVNISRRNRAAANREVNGRRGRLFLGLTVGFAPTGYFAELVGVGERDGDDEDGEVVEKPRLFEPWMKAEGLGEMRWEEIMPVSATLLRRSDSLAKPLASPIPIPEPPPPPPVPLPTRNPHAIHGLSLPRWTAPAPAPAPSPSPTPMAKTKKKTKKPPPLPETLMLQVAFMISMPSPPSENGTRMEHYEFGVAEFPWAATTTTTTTAAKGKEAVGGAVT